MTTTLRPPGVLLAALATAAAVCSLGRSASAQQDSGGPLKPEQAAYDVLHYDLRLAVDPDARSIEGVLTATVRVVSDMPVLLLDLDPALAVEKVTAGEDECVFKHEDGQLRITLANAAAKGDEVAVAVAYGGVPRVAPNAPWDGGFTWRKTKAGHPWIATTCQTDGADLWWPCKDHPSDEPESFDLHITVPKPLVCATNGRLVKVEAAGKVGGKSARTYHWHVSTPINNYGIALNIAPYVTLKKKYKSVAGDTFPVIFWVLPEHKERAKPFFVEFLGHLRWFEEKFGPYPFRADKYGIVETPHLGMEHQTIIAYGNRFPRARAFDYDWLHHHELSHEWWGNLVTCRDWKDMWIHEGIGTYTQWLYIEDKHGEAAYLKYARQQSRSARNSAPVAPRGITSSKRIYGGDIYHKGAAILHTLRWLIGKDKLMVALRRMAYPDPALEKTSDGSACRFVDTDEFRGIVEEVAGMKLGWFFDVYLHQPALPSLQTEVVDGDLVLQWVVPGDLPFPMPVQVEVRGKGRRVEMPEGRAKVVLAGGKWDVDPDEWVLVQRARRRRR